MTCLLSREQYIVSFNNYKCIAASCDIRILYNKSK